MSYLTAGQWLIHHNLLRTRSIWQLVGAQGVFLIKEGKKQKGRGEGLEGRGKRNKGNNHLAKNQYSSLLFRMGLVSH